MSSSTASLKELPLSDKQQSGAKSNEYEDAERNYKPKSLKFWTIIVAVLLALFLVALDRTIIATAIPKITDDFNSIEDIGWYGSAYMLTAACFTPISGRIYQLHSTKWVFLIAIVIFEIGSALCGAAPSSTTFIIGRAIAGLGSAFITSGTMMIILPLVPLRKRPVFVSLFGIVFGVSSVLGPIIGGTLTDHVSWRWCFYINLPIGGFAMLVVLFFLSIDSPKREKLPILGQLKRLDPVGIVLFVPSITCLILALQWGGSAYAWSAPKVIGLLVTFAVLFVAFVVYEALTPETAMAPTRVVLNRSVAGSMLFVFLLSGGMMSVLYYLTVWFQAAKGDSPMHAGVSTIPFIVSMIILGVVTGIFTQKVGYYVPPLLLSPILCAIGSGLLSTLTPRSNHSAWIGFQVLYGFGIGCGFQTSNLPSQNVLPRADVPLGLALQFFMQQLGGAVFLAVSQNVFSSKLISSLSGVPGVDVRAIVNTGATDFRSMVPADQLEMVIEAYSHALTRVFVLTAALSACMILGASAVKWQKLQGKERQQPDTKLADVESAVEVTEEKTK